jgi:ChrR Cupin-like domain
MKRRPKANTPQTSAKLVATSALDADIVNALDGAGASDVAPDSLVDRLRAKVLITIADDVVDAHTTVHAHENTWQPFRERIEFKLLNHVDGVASYLLRLQPGAVLPAHRHPIDEECVVLEGELRIGERLVLKAGGFHLARKELPHADITTDTGALIFLRGAMPSRKHKLVATT